MSIATRFVHYRLKVYIITYMYIWFNSPRAFSLKIFSGERRVLLGVLRALCEPETGQNRHCEPFAACLQFRPVESSRGFAMRVRHLMLLVGLLISTSGCADFLLHSLVGAFPEAYSGGGGSVQEKQADLDRHLEGYRAENWTTTE
jgi:hypothetical protein